MATARRAGPRDMGFLSLALGIAADWRAGTQPRSAEEVLASADLARYLPDWLGGRDRGLVVEAAPGHPVGAAWWRFFPVDDPGYGFVSAEVPEVSVGVVPEYRGQGIGTLLLRGLITLAAEEGLPRLSLSVEPDNYAAGLYQRVGFVRVGRNGGADTMLLSLREGQVPGAAAGVPVEDGELRRRLLPDGQRQFPEGPPTPGGSRAPDE